nr:queuosine precursor transporter [Aestuariimicrobium kwangyangense]
MIETSPTSRTQPDTAGPAWADPGSGHYAVLLASISVVVILSNIGGSKGVQFGPIITDGGFFLFPLAYILGDVITELYGARAARRAIVMGFIAAVVSVICYAIIIVLPGFNDDYGIAKQSALETALGPVWQIVLAGLLGYAAGQTLNSTVMVLMKRRTLERGLFARLASSTGLGELVDTLVFCTVAATAIGITTVGQWANYTCFGFVYKVAVQYAVMPATAWLIKWLKRHEPSYRPR